MPGSRNNHYVPQWYQAGFMEPGAKQLAYLDLTPRVHTHNGRSKPERSRFKSYPSQCFVERDLYSTFFGTPTGEIVNDEIERKLFGAIDTTGAPAVKAFIGTDVNAWIRHFQDFFLYIDIQKLRTMKGLDWLRAQYPGLTQNELMWEMQALQTISCATWTEGVREIVSAEDSPVKFIVTDHPVTVFNAGLPPGSADARYPFDPKIALNGSQTIFPLNRDYCLVLTNLEYARDRTIDPLKPRTAARNFRAALTRADALIRTRKLSEEEVRHINMAMKTGARRYLAAGQEAWLFPEAGSAPTWPDIAATLRPPAEELWEFGGEIFAKFESGKVAYQDEFGRAEPEHLAEFAVEAATPKRSDPCGCGAPRRFRDCCEPIAPHLRRSWTEMNIRARNLALYDAANDIFSLSPDRSWTDVRRDMTDEKIRSFYEVFAALWPLETDLLKLLPKPDGRPRAVYTGLVHPQVITEVAAGAGLYFGELIVQHPIIHPRIIAPEYSPLDNPQAYRAEVLKALHCFITLMPLVDIGLVNLTPDPCAFDAHLRDAGVRLAQARYKGREIKPDPNDRIMKLMEADVRRALLQLPDAVLAAQFREQTPGLSNEELTKLMNAVAISRELDPLAVLQPERLAGEKSGQLTAMSMVPSFEMVMYLAQATGSCIVTDSKFRFTELVEALVLRGANPSSGLPAFARDIASQPLAFPQNVHEIVTLALGADAPYPQIIGDATSYLQSLERRGHKPNFEKQLSARLTRARATQAFFAKSGAQLAPARMLALLPEEGLRDITVNRLLLMSGSENHWRTVPAAFYVELTD